MWQNGLSQANQLNLFLMDVEKRAWRIAVVSVNNPDDAADITQDAMLALVEKYGDRSAQEWPPLFWRILNNKIKDFQRRSTVRRRWNAIVGKSADDEDDNALEQLSQDHTGPLELLGAQVAATDAYQAIHSLPPRQREAFCFRVWEGLDVKQTALAMGCSAGSVKTHLHRALESLRQTLGAHLDSLSEPSSSANTEGGLA